ncbi:serine/threonine-protein kinase [Kitasatospora kifunensis]|uniref:Putative Ser/Thr protein kinase n=1 Tax=Kitasatospora kifunensis TaxID=58351 RepID=A0A7W7VUA8_KITKI|nr:serine/threonine-protein kinase [Kitasatospora kifunensis]MBB4922648.1 putative Ser/Thr protein kinase [Kitasatospora kifunensis]
MTDYLWTNLRWAALAVLGPVLVLRLLSLPLLLRVQQGVRQRALAARGEGAASAWTWAVACGELVLELGGAVGLELFMHATRDNLRGFGLLLASIGAGGDTSWLSMELHIRRAEGQTYFLYAAIPVLVVWLLLWFLTQRRLLTAGMPAGTWSSPSVRGRLAGLFLLRLLLGVFLPAGILLAGLLIQVVALVASLRFRSADSAATAAPLPPAQPGAFGPSGSFGPPLSYAPSAQPAPPVPSFPPSTPAPAQPAPYLPTQADRGAGAVPQVKYQQLHPNEPRTIGGYQLLGRIGSGGMGTVYLARREGAATQVALKTINPELLDHDELLRRFEREAQVLAMVSGAYTARVLDSGLDAGRPYLAMELLDGRPLDVHLREQGPIRSPEALRALALALAVALSGVHRLGLVHRDLKPANIMLTSAGPRLLDFGIAAIVDGTRLTRTGGGPGTLTYMAPEQFGDEAVGTAADVWAWACCVVCAAHGSSPFAATNTGAVIRRIVDTGPEPAALMAVQALDPALAAAITRALSIDPAGRPADGTALVELLTARQGPDHAPADEGTLREQITQGWRALTL